MQLIPQALRVLRQVVLPGVVATTVCLFVFDLLSFDFGLRGAVFDLLSFDFGPWGLWVAPIFLAYCLTAALAAGMSKGKRSIYPRAFLIPALYAGFSALFLFHYGR